MLVGVQSQLKNVFIGETLPGFSFNFVPFRRLTVNNSIVIPAGSALKKPIQRQCRTPAQPRISQQHAVLPHGSQSRVPDECDPQRNCPDRSTHRTCKRGWEQHCVENGSAAKTPQTQTSPPGYLCYQVWATQNQWAVTVIRRMKGDNLYQKKNLSQLNNLLAAIVN